MKLIVAKTDRRLGRRFVEYLRGLETNLGTEPLHTCKSFVEYLRGLEVIISMTMAVMTIIRDANRTALRFRNDNQNNDDLLKREEFEIGT